MSAPIRLGLVGFGKIARDEHVPAIVGEEAFELVAVASPGADVPGLRCYEGARDMLEAEPGLDAIVLCQPPQARFEAARAALLSGKHVFLEKPPGATVAEVKALAVLARLRGLTLFSGWHSRFARGIAPARDWLAGRTVERIAIRWREDVRKWHPGQDWIWERGGFGVFDPGMNALSILTAIVDEPVHLLDAELEIPANRAVPIAARLAMATLGGAEVSAELDWRETGTEVWDVELIAGGECRTLVRGGDGFGPDGPAAVNGLGCEYPAMYRHFAKLVGERRCDVDVSPLQLVADAFLCGRQRITEAFRL